MKLMVVTPYFYPKIGGLENYAWNIANKLQSKYKMEIVSICANHKGNNYKEEYIKGIKIYRLPYLFKASNTPINIMWYKNINDIIEKEKPNIINGHLPVPFIADVTAKIAKQKNIPFVLTYHNDLKKENPILQNIINGYYILMFNKTVNIAKKIIATSELYANQSTHLKKYKNKIEIIPPGVDIDYYDSIQLSSDLKNKYKNTKIILFVGQLDKTHIHKGLYNLINSIANIEKNVKLLVVGRGDMKDEYIKYAMNKSLSERFEIIDNANDEMLVKYYKLSDVVVLPSINKSEGFGMILIEAGACNKPVIGSDIGGIPYVIKNNETGILVKPNNISQLTNSINKIIKNKELAKKYGENGRKRVVNSFSWDIQTKKFNKLLNDIKEGEK